MIVASLLLWQISVAVSAAFTNNAAADDDADVHS